MRQQTAAVEERIERVEGQCKSFRGDELCSIPPEDCQGPVESGLAIRSGVFAMVGGYKCSDAVDVGDVC